MRRLAKKANIPYHAPGVDPHRSHMRRLYEKAGMKYDYKPEPELKYQKKLKVKSATTETNATKTKKTKEESKESDESKESQTSKESKKSQDSKESKSSGADLKKESTKGITKVTKVTKEATKPPLPESKDQSANTTKGTGSLPKTHQVEKAKSRPVHDSKGKPVSKSAKKTSKGFTETTGTAPVPKKFNVIKDASTQTGEEGEEGIGTDLEVSRTRNPSAESTPKKVDAATNTVNEAADNTKAAVSGATDLAEETGNAAGQAVAGTADALVDAADQTEKVASDAAGTAVNVVAGAGEVVAEAADTTLEASGNAAREVGATAAEAADTALEASGKVAGEVGATAAEAADTAIEESRNVAREVGATATEAADTAVIVARDTAQAATKEAAVAAAVAGNAATAALDITADAAVATADSALEIAADVADVATATADEGFLACANCAVNAGYAVNETCGSTAPDNQVVCVDACDYAGNKLDDGTDVAFDVVNQCATTTCNTLNAAVDTTGDLVVDSTDACVYVASQPFGLIADCAGLCSDEVQRPKSRSISKAKGRRTHDSRGKPIITTAAQETESTWNDRRILTDKNKTTAITSASKASRRRTRKAALSGPSVVHSKAMSTDSPPSQRIRGKSSRANRTKGTSSTLRVATPAPDDQVNKTTTQAPNPQGRFDVNKNTITCMDNINLYTPDCF